MTSGIKDFTFTFSGQIIAVCLAIGTQSCLAWTLLPEGRGSYAVCFIFSTLLGIVFSIGCQTAFVYFVASKRFTISEAIIYTFMIGFVTSLAAICTGLIILQLPYSFTAKAPLRAFHLAIVYTPVALFANIFLQLLTSLGKFRLFAVLTILRELNRLVFVLIFVLGFSQGVEGALLASIASDTVIIILTLGFYLFKYKATWIKPKIYDLREVFLYGARYYLGTLSNMVNVQIGTIILALFASREEIGLFAVASALTLRVQIIPNSLVATLIPRVAGNQTNRQELVAQCARITGVICGILLLILVVFATPIVSILFSPAFLPSADLIRVLIIGVISRCACKVFVPYLLGNKRPGIVSFSVATGMVTNLLLMYLLLPVYGLTGAAISVTMNYLVSSAILAISFNRFSGLSMREIWFLKRSDWKPLGNAICGLVKEKQGKYERSIKDHYRSAK